MNRHILKLLWNLRATPMRRVLHFVLMLAAVFAVNTPAAHAARKRVRVAPATVAHHSSHSKQKPVAAPAAKRTRAKSQRAEDEGQVRPAVLQRRLHGRRGRAALRSQAERRQRSDDAGNSADERQPVVEEASLQTSQQIRKSVLLPPPLRGSFESLARQNAKTEDDNLERILDDDDLNDRIARKMLVPLPISSSLIINGNLPENRRYCRPWTAEFLSDLVRAHAAAFRRSLIVSSAVRTVDYQKRLMETNGNAAQAEGDVASPHLTGAAIDIAKQGLSRQEMAWMRTHLLTLQEAGKIDVEEEFRQLCFHITVYKSYVSPTSPIHTEARIAPETQKAPEHEKALQPAKRPATRLRRQVKPALPAAPDGASTASINGI